MDVVALFRLRKHSDDVSQSAHDNLVLTSLKHLHKNDINRQNGRLDNYRHAHKCLQ